MLDTSWAVGENVCTVDDSSIIISIIIIVRKSLQLLELVNDCVDVVLILRISSVIRVKLDCRFK